jgi:hypothetical protein
MSDIDFDLLLPVVAACRETLEGDVRTQLEGTFGILPADGRFLDPGDFQPGGDPTYFARRDHILEAICHLERMHGGGRRQAVEQFVRESAFTTLNRLAALKLMEHPSRALIRESVGRGDESSGFVQFRKVCPGLCRAARNNDQADGGYRLYLECLFDDLGRELGVLFDRGLPQSLLFPSRRCLEAVLARLNAPDLAPAWARDETIGWIYQYFTSPAERARAREEAAPRNSYDMSCRNQFYTPRYVVRFLVDNTFGRLWYEMRRGDTVLADSGHPAYCRYLVRPPGEVFLGPGEEPPAEEGGEPAGRMVRHRPPRDPRELRVLDPACGSGHFLLYAYDVLTAAYREAWASQDWPPFIPTGRTLRQDYPTAEALERALPGLVLRHNLFGVDIDLRSTQIAALALWLRAQRSYQEQKVPIGERPVITRTDIVCAEPMPGEEEERQAFVATLEPPVLGQLFQRVFEHMALAGEAGSLLKLEELLRGDIAAARRRWQEGPVLQQRLLFGDAIPAPQQDVLFDPSGVTNEEFWDHAFGRVLDELRRFTERGSTADAYRCRLFADDAARGFAFVDLFQHDFDVVLMNPPFGETSAPSRDYVYENYPRSRENILAAFVERGLEKLRPGGFLGAITSRTVFFLKTVQRWREELVLGRARPTVFADLGDRVLHTALVEAAAYCLEVAR